MVDDTIGKRVLYVSHAADLFGAEVCLLDLVTELDKQRFLPVVVLPGSGPLKIELEQLGVPIETLPSLRAWLTRRSGIQRLLHFLAVLPFIVASTISLTRIIRRYQIDLVHTNSSVVISGALAARLCGVPHVWHVRELLVPETIFNFVLGARFVVSTIKHLSVRVIAISFGVQRTLCQHDETSRVVVIHDGVRPELYESSESRSRVRAGLGISENVVLVGEIGRVSAIKGYADLVEAAAIVCLDRTDVEFISVGGSGRSKTDRTYETHVRQTIAGYGLQDRFHLIGFYESVADVLSAIDLVVLPSLSEASGRVLIEAMAAGKPVIGTRVGGIPDIVDHGENGLLVPPGSPRDLAQAILNVLQHPDRGQAMGMVGREKARRHFSLLRYVSEIEALYEQVT